MFATSKNSHVCVTTVAGPSLEARALVLPGNSIVYRVAHWSVTMHGGIASKFVFSFFLQTLSTASTSWRCATPVLQCCATNERTRVRDSEVSSCFLPQSLSKGMENKKEKKKHLQGVENKKENAKYLHRCIIQVTLHAHSIRALCQTHAGSIKDQLQHTFALHKRGCFYIVQVRRSPHEKFEI